MWTHRILIVTVASSLIAGAAIANPPTPDAPSRTAKAYDPTADYDAGKKALAAGDYRAASRAFDRVLSALPTDANVLLLAGLAKSGSGDMRGAQRSYERALRADKTNADARRELALLLAKQGNAARAGEELMTLRTQADACKTGCEPVKSAVAAVESALGGKPAAAAPASLLFASAGQGDHAYHLAIGLVNSKRYEEAITALQTAERTFGPHPDVLTYLGFANRKLGRLEDAERYYQSALKVAPEHKGATEYYGELKVERGDLDGARQLLASLERICAFGCPEEQELRRWIDAAGRS